MTRSQLNNTTLIKFGHNTEQESVCVCIDNATQRADLEVTEETSHTQQTTSVVWEHLPFVKIPELKKHGHLFGAPPVRCTTVSRTLQLLRKLCILAAIAAAAGAAAPAAKVEGTTNATTAPLEANDELLLIEAMAFILNNVDAASVRPPLQPLLRLEQSTNCCSERRWPSSCRMWTQRP